MRDNQLIKRQQNYEDCGYWQPFTLGDCLSQWAKKFGQNIALVDKNCSLTYKEFDDLTQCYMVKFYQHGIQNGERVLVQLPNNIAFMVTCFALFRIGAIPILTTMSHRLNDMKSICQQGEPVAFITTSHFLGFDHLELAKTLLETFDCLKYLIIEDNVDIDITGNKHITDDFNSYRPLPHYRDIAFLLLSGGTTGTSKLIPRTHTDYSYFSRTAAEVTELNHNSVYLAVLPASHNFTLGSPGILGTMSVGGKVVLAETPAPDLCFLLIEQQKVTITSLVPALAGLWLEDLDNYQCDLSSLQVIQVGGARLTPAIAKQLSSCFHCKLQQVFGMAEGLNCLTHLNEPDEIIFYTQGRPISIADELKVVDVITGKEVATNEMGELLVRGPYTINEYYHAEEQTKHSFTIDGFYRSGDLVRLTESGHLIVEGRIKEQINRNGEKISPAEIESQLCSIKGIRDAVLIGLPDSSRGEISCAYLIADLQYSITDLYKIFNERNIARYKWPDRIEYINCFPLTKIGKIDKQKLIDLALEKFN